MPTRAISRREPSSCSTENSRRPEFGGGVLSLGAVEGFELKRQSELAEILRGWGLPSFSWTELGDGPKGAFERICELEEVRADFPYNTDGAVVKLDDCSLHAPPE